MQVDFDKVVGYTKTSLSLLHRVSVRTLAAMLLSFDLLRRKQLSFLK